jgi:hypothetical protein
MRHHLRTLHPILLPGAILFASFLGLLLTSREGEVRIMLVLMATGIAVLVAVWLILRQYLDTLIMGAQGYGELREWVLRLNAIHDAEIERYERRRRGGPDTPGPPPEEPHFNP